MTFLQQTVDAMPSVELPEEYELVVQTRHDDEDGENTVRWEYYYVDHRSRCLFWLFPFEADDYLGEISGPLSPAHFSKHIDDHRLLHRSLTTPSEHLLESWYWYAMQLTS